MLAELSYVGPRHGSSTNVQLNSGDDYQLPAYATVNATLSSRNLHVLSTESETRLMLRVDNLFDQRHSEPGELGFDLPTLGRTVRCEVRQLF